METPAVEPTARDRTPPIRRLLRRPRVVIAATALLIIAVAAVWVLAISDLRVPQPLVPRDRVLRQAPVFLYRNASVPTRAVLLFLGNDVGFWNPHRRLAARLAARGIAVIGIDHRAVLDALPDSLPREITYPARIHDLLSRSETELGTTTVPLIVGGHSSGAEAALWLANHGTWPRFVGVLAMSPRARGHLRVTVADLGNIVPSGSDAFAIATLIRALPDTIRCALVRGSKDPFRGQDSALAAIAPQRVRAFRVPFASHSLRGLLVAGPVIDDAIAYLLRYSSADGP